MSAASTATLRGSDRRPRPVVSRLRRSRITTSARSEPNSNPSNGVQLAALTPSSAIASEKRSLIGRLLLGLVGSLLLIAVVAYVAGRSIVGSLARLAEGANSIAAGRLRERVPIKGRDEFAALGRAFNKMAAQLEARMDELEKERRRLREANARFGDALAATLDAEQLRRVIVESAVEATHADGGVVIAEDGSFVETGDVGAGGARLDFELKAGLRELRPSSPRRRRIRRRGADDRRVARRAGSCGARGIYRLHQMVERQALVDGLTGLANRGKATLPRNRAHASEERLGGPVGLILADVDDFKLVNDRHGHPTGDIVLRDLAQALHETVREIDTAARWGGEEFAVILPGTDLMGAAHVAERVRQALSERGLCSRRRAYRCTSPQASVLPPQSRRPRCPSSLRRPMKRCTGRSVQGRIVFTPAPSR